MCDDLTVITVIPWWMGQDIQTKFFKKLGPRVNLAHLKYLKSFISFERKVFEDG